LQDWQINKSTSILVSTKKFLPAIIEKFVGRELYLKGKEIYNKICVLKYKNKI